MAEPFSRWRRIAREVIGQVVDGLPLHASVKDLRKALRNAYPFGVRAYHPYKCWLTEVRIATRKFGLHEARSQDYSHRTILQHSPFSLLVVCGMCDGKIAGGCLQCAGATAKAAEIRSVPEWAAFASQFRDDPEFALLAVSDWLQERGIDAEEA